MYSYWHVDMSEANDKWIRYHNSKRATDMNVISVIDLT